MPTSRRSLARRVAAAATALWTLASCTGSSRPPVPVPAPSTPAPISQAGPSQRPNIVFVLTDDLSTDLVRYMPHVVQLERSGASFGNYFVVDSLCCPSRAAIFTGQYPHDDGVYTNFGSDGGYDTFTRRGDAERTFAVALQHAGYRTALLGKYLNGYEPNDAPAPGWDEWGVAGNGYAEYDYALNADGRLARHGHTPADYLTDVLSRRAQDFIGAAARDRKPFALEVATFAPHKPSVPAPPDVGTFPRITAPRGPAFGRLPTAPPRWLADNPPLTGDDVLGLDSEYQHRVESVQAVDRMIGALEDAVRRAGQARNTYFVFSSDNGYHMGQYRLLAGKQTAFDTDIRVPLVISGPGVAQNDTIDAMASSIDLGPTFAGLAGTRMPDADGTSLQPLLTGSTPSGWQDAVLVEHHSSGNSPADPDVQSVRAGKPPDYEAIRTPDYLFAEYGDGDLEYYDLHADPYELHDVAAGLSSGRLAALRASLARLRDCRGTAACQAAARPG